MMKSHAFGVQGWLRAEPKVRGGKSSDMIVDVSLQFEAPGVCLSGSIYSAIRGFSLLQD